jgi:catechol 2,3-dioxygenase-like lactoylglutathione lyase family enzyme
MINYTMEHIHLFSTDAEVAGKFYAEAFGIKTKMSKTWQGLPRCDMKLGELTVLISTVKGDLQETAGDRNAQLGINHFGFRVDDMDEACTDLKAKGVVFTQEPVDFKGGKVAFIEGPDRVSIEIVEF